MNPEQAYPEQPATLSKPNPLQVDQPGEKVVCEVKRHPIGIVGNYVTTGLGLLAALVLGIIIIRQAVGADSQAHITTLFVAGWVVLTALCILFLLISSKIYWSNRWIVTTDSLTQVQQLGLFRKQVSQLSMANLEDVTAVQNGPLQSMFHFGTLRVETAGEHSKFVFPYCPNPNDYARQILSCRESFIRNDPDMAHRANDMLDTPHYAVPPATVPTQTIPTAPATPDNGQLPPAVPPTLPSQPV